MTAIPNNKPSFLTKARAIVSKTFTDLTEDNLHTVIKELQVCCADLIRATTEVQDKQIQSRATEPDGFPKHLSRCELFDGQFLRLTQTAASPQIVSMDHGLRRRPTSAMFIKQSTTNNQVLIAGDTATNTPPASEFTVSFRLTGAIGEEHICILF